MEYETNQPTPEVQGTRKLFLIQDWALNHCYTCECLELMTQKTVAHVFVPAHSMRTSPPFSAIIGFSDFIFTVFTLRLYSFTLKHGTRKSFHQEIPL